VAASAAIIARDLGVGLARQILIYPMLDDRTVGAGAVAPFLTWTSDMNLDRVRCAPVLPSPAAGKGLRLPELTRRWRHRCSTYTRKLTTGEECKP
jgi:hypothetical protein